MPVIIILPVIVTALGILYLAGLGVMTLIPYHLGGTPSESYLIIPEAGVVSIETAFGSRQFSYSLSPDLLQVTSGQGILEMPLNNGKAEDLTFRPR